MFQKSGKYYADWRDKAGQRLRKSFTSKAAALQFEAEQKDLAHPKNQARGQRSPKCSAPTSTGTKTATASEVTPTKTLIAIAGSLAPAQLRPAHITEAVARLNNPRYAITTRNSHTIVLRRLLRWLWDTHGAPKLDRHVPTLTPRAPAQRHRHAQPKSTPSSRTQRPRSARSLHPLLRPRHSQRNRHHVSHPSTTTPSAKRSRFATKKDAHVTLAITGAVRDLIDGCDLSNPLPFVTQKRREECFRARYMKRPWMEVSIAPQRTQRPPPAPRHHQAASSSTTSAAPPPSPLLRYTNDLRDRASPPRPPQPAKHHLVPRSPSHSRQPPPPSNSSSAPPAEESEDGTA